MKSREFNVVYRVCDKVNALNAVREFGSKKQVLAASYRSILESIKHFKRENGDASISVSIVFDNATDAVRDEIVKAFSDESLGLTSFRTVVTSGGGAVESFRAAYEEAKKMRGYVLFIEDDYVVEPQCFDEMFSFANLWSESSHVCLKPHQEIAEFTRDAFGSDGKYFKREVFLSKQRYWIRVKKSTCTFLVDDFVLKDCADLFEATCSLSKLTEAFTNKIFLKHPLFSPIAPIADHCHTVSGVRPYFSGRKLQINFEYDSKKI